MKAVVFVKESERLPGKHMMEICGEPMLRRICRTLERTNMFDRVIIYSKYPKLELQGCIIQRDVTRGTLIDSIIEAIREHEEFLAVGGDMPLIDSEIISMLVTRYDGEPIAAVDSEGTTEPLFAIYNTAILEDMIQFSKRSKQIFNFVNNRFRLVKLDAEKSKKLFNVNLPTDLEIARRAADCSGQQQ